MESLTRMVRNRIIRWSKSSNLNILPCGPRSAIRTERLPIWVFCVFCSILSCRCFLFLESIYSPSSILFPPLHLFWAYAFSDVDKQNLAYLCTLSIVSGGSWGLMDPETNQPAGPSRKLICSRRHESHTRLTFLRVLPAGFGETLDPQGPGACAPR